MSDQAPPPRPAFSASPPRFIIIGAGSRGFKYAEAIASVSNGVVAAVADPRRYSRESLGATYIWGRDGAPAEGQCFTGWTEFIEYEQQRRRREAAGEDGVPPGVDGAFICVLDEMHRDVVVALGPLGLHIMCEKPLACSMADCLDMYKALRLSSTARVFSIGHVLRYSPHNIMLRRLLVEDRVIGDINSVVHTEPVGWWHFTHSYVRGNWRNDKTTGPSLLTKSCHDIDLLLWMLCSPPRAGHGEPHLPESVMATGGLQFFKRSRKPKAAGDATNCMRCPLGDEGCKYSAKHVYLGDCYDGLGTGNTQWPVNVAVHDIEDYGTREAQREAMTRALEEDYDAATTPPAVVAARNWFGRCVFESDNNVCDDEFVAITWPETADRPAKRVAFHMAAQTTRQCQRFSRFYGEHGEIHADSRTIVVEDFATKETRTYHPRIEDIHHGGGDLGLTRQFVLACDAVKSHGWSAKDAQNEYIGCTLDDVLRSHAMVFAAEEARVQKKVVDWTEWWDRTVMRELGES
jgi:predicted dehydrogenase